MRYPVYIAMAALLASCTPKQKADLSAGLPLPTIPESLTAPHDRACYAVEHFWEPMDFTDETCALDTAFMEQAFANYAQFMQIALPDEKMSEKVDRVLEQASANPNAYAFLAEIAEKYLYDFDSPMRNEDVYLYFVDGQLKNEKLDVARRAVLENQKHNISLNKPGMTATDFRIKQRDGKEYKFSDISKGIATLLIFHDPDCTNCHNLVEGLSLDPWVTRLVDEGRLKIILVAGADTADRWEKTEGNVPTSWVEALDISDVDGNGLYDLYHSPSMYLISDGGVILLKDACIDDVISHLSFL